VYTFRVKLPYQGFRSKLNLSIFTDTVPLGFSFVVTVPWTMKARPARQGERSRRTWALREVADPQSRQIELIGNHRDRRPFPILPLPLRLPEREVAVTVFRPHLEIVAPETLAAARIVENHTLLVVRKLLPLQTFSGILSSFGVSAGEKRVSRYRQQYCPHHGSGVHAVATGFHHAVHAAGRGGPRSTSRARIEFRGRLWRWHSRRLHGNGSAKAWSW